MPRPAKMRRVGFMPGATYFKPAGIPLRAMEEVCISMEEAEAVRLKDLEGLEQEAAALKMNISRPTFQRVLAVARRKIADALLNGKAIHIDGGNFELVERRFQCANGHQWDLPSVEGTAVARCCPTCKMPPVAPFGKPGRDYGGQGRLRRGKCRW